MDIGVIPVRLSDYLSEDLIFLDLVADSKIDAFRAMVSNMAIQEAIAEPGVFLNEVIAREDIEPTCIGRGVAFPHTRTRCVEKPIIAFARPAHAIPFAHSNPDEVKFIFMMGTPKDEANEYLHILARLCRLLRRTDFRNKLLAASTPKEILQLFNDYETSPN